MITNDEKFNSILNIVDVTNNEAFRGAMTELSMELVNSLDHGKIKTDAATMGVIQAIIIIALAGNVSQHDDPSAARH